MNPEISSTDRPLDRWGRNAALGRIADAIQPTVQALLECSGKRRVVKDVLHGTFLGHALHPMLTDVPIGAWTVTATCDLLDVAHIRRYRETADVALTIGIAGASGAALSGWADWSDTKDEPQRLGVLHAALNAGALTLYVISALSRRNGQRAFGIVTGLAGFAALVTAAYVGGELSLGMQLGAKHTSVPIEPADEFVRVFDDVTAIGEADMEAADAAGIPLLLTRRDGTVHAVGGVCTHRGASLAGADHTDNCVRCPWHGSRFALDNGRVIEGPATFGLPVFETSVEGDAVRVRPRR